MIEQLNQKFATTGLKFVEGHNGFVKAVVQTPRSSAEIYLHGAHVTSFVSRAGGELLWLSPDAVFKPGKAIRGGIPLCWPWFAGHPTDADKPTHGFARNVQWQVLEAGVSDDEGVLVFGLTDNEQTRQLWPYPFELRYTVRVGWQLGVELSYCNLADTTVEIHRSVTHLSGGG